MCLSRTLSIIMHQVIHRALLIVIILFDYSRLWTKTKPQKITYGLGNSLLLIDSSMLTDIWYVLRNINICISFAEAKLSNRVMQLAIWHASDFEPPDGQVRSGQVRSGQVRSGRVASRPKPCGRWGTGSIFFHFFSILRHPYSDLYRLMHPYPHIPYPALWSTLRPRLPCTPCHASPYEQVFLASFSHAQAKVPYLFEYNANACKTRTLNLRLNTGVEFFFLRTRIANGKHC